MAPRTVPLSSRPLRLAIGHLVELAAAFESARERDPHAERVLKRVLSAMMPHVERKRDRRMHAWISGTVTLVAAAYERLQKDEDFGLKDLQRSLVALFAKRRRHLTAKSLAELANVDESEIRDAGGPLECAKRRVAAVYGVHPSTVHKWGREARSTLAYPLPKKGAPLPRGVLHASGFGRFLRESEIARYADGALDARRRDVETPPVLPGRRRQGGAVRAPLTPPRRTPRP